MTEFILASRSPRRQELLKNLGLRFKVAVDSTPEETTPGLKPFQVVMKLAEKKARNIARTCGGIILAADTVVVLDGEILGKPKDEQQAVLYLERLNGRGHEVYTGFCVYDTESGKVKTDFEKTTVFFRKLDEKEIMHYVRTGEPMDKAGGYGIQGLGALFIEKIEGDYFNVMGLPLCKLGKILKTEFQICLL